MYPIIHYHLQATWIPFKNVVLLCTSLVMRKWLGCNMQGYFSTHRVRTLFQKQVSRTFPGLFQNWDWFFKAPKFTLTPTLTRSQCQFSLLSSIHFIFLVEFNRFPELSRTSGLFPELSSPGKCHSKIPGLSRFSRTCTNPPHIDEGQICLFTVYPVHWLYYVEETFFHKKNNADTVPVLKKIYHEHWP